MKHSTGNTTRERLITIRLNSNHPEFREDAVVLVTPAGVLTGPVVGDDFDDLAYATGEDVERCWGRVGYRTDYMQREPSARLLTPSGTVVVPVCRVPPRA